MTKLPQVTAKETLKRLQKSGMSIDRKTGGHFILRGKDGRYAVIPMHPSVALKKGTLKNILTGAKITVEEFKKL
jgi:predicted RNA binding protein YcfA (HicA-like mRNA interferase family)